MRSVTHDLEDDRPSRMDDRDRPSRWVYPWASWRRGQSYQGDSLAGQETPPLSDAENAELQARTEEHRQRAEADAAWRTEQRAANERAAARNHWTATSGRRRREVPGSGASLAGDGNPVLRREEADAIRLALSQSGVQIPRSVWRATVVISGMEPFSIDAAAREELEHHLGDLHDLHLGRISWTIEEVEEVAGGRHGRAARGAQTLQSEQLALDL